MVISCVIPTFRQLNYLYQTIDSVLTQDYEKIELIITDDCSEGFCCEKILSYIENNKKRNIVNVIVRKNAVNEGTVKNFNNAIREATGQIIVPLASDDKFYDESVVRRIANQFKEKNCDVLVCTRLKYNREMTKAIRKMPHPKYVPHLFKIMDTAQHQYKNIALGYDFEFASGAAMYYKKSLFENVGCYDERYKLWEDGPFIAKITRLGIKIEMNYDIISICYRDGGISSKKTNPNSIIMKDYCNYHQYEFLNYKENFTEKEYDLLSSIKSFMQINNKISIINFIKYKKAVINKLHIKLCKFILRYIPYRR